MGITCSKQTGKFSSNIRRGSNEYLGGIPTQRQWDGQLLSETSAVIQLNQNKAVSMTSKKASMDKTDETRKGESLTSQTGVGNSDKEKETGNINESSEFKLNHTPDAADEDNISMDRTLESFKSKYDDYYGDAGDLTKSEIETVCQLIAKRAKRAIQEAESSQWKGRDGKYTKPAKDLLHVFDEAYMFLMSPNVPVEYLVESRRSVANLALSSDVIEKICGIVIEIYEAEGVPSWDDTTGSWTDLYYSITILWNYTDTSEEWTERVTNSPGFLDTMHRMLTDIRSDQTAMHTDQEQWALLAALGIVHNLSMVEANTPALRDKKFTEALQTHLKSSNKKEHLAALASLAGIINEEESEIINSNERVVKHLMRVLKRGLKTAERRYEGWTCKESALTIKLLGRNDANKRLLVRLGALPLLVELAKGSIEEQTVSLNAIWVLSFDEENQKVMVETEGLQLVETVYNLKRCDNEKIKAAANGTLWNLRDELRMSKNQKYQDIGKQIMPGRETDVNEGKVDDAGTTQSDKNRGEGHIMISYQWSNQKTLIDIRNELHKHGLKVWMDVDNMAGSTLQAMAEAVENADMVLLCYSKKYKNSPNCRLEAEYTFLRQKSIIPLRMERDYMPDGWLGILLGTKLFFDFSGKYEFGDKFNKLLIEVKRVKTDLSGAEQNAIVPKNVEPLYHSVDVIDGPVILTHQELQATPKVTDAVTLVKQWTSDDIQNWTIQQNLPKKQFGSLTVDEITLLLNMRREAPESFYTYLDKLLKSNFRLIAQLVRALEEIGKCGHL